MTKSPSILKDGSIVLGNSVVCDGYVTAKSTAVFSHIHDDHIEKFETAIGNCEHVLVSRPTYELLAVLKGEILRYRNNLQALDFCQPFYSEQGGDLITLYDSNHILGSSQILVTCTDGSKIAYSGDFNFPAIAPVKCDKLVLDSSHGEPIFDVNYDNTSLERRLIDCVKDEGYLRGKSVIIRSHRGTMQNLMSIINNSVPGQIPFIASEKDCKIAKVYEKYGLKCRTFEDSTTRRLVPSKIDDRANFEAIKIRNSQYPYIEFLLPQSIEVDAEMEGALSIRIGLDFSMQKGQVIRQIDDTHISIGIDAHASMSKIVEYVRATGAKEVVTDNLRSNFGNTLAEEIRDRLGVNAWSEPERYES